MRAQKSPLNGLRQMIVGFVGRGSMCHLCAVTLATLQYHCNLVLNTMNILISNDDGYQAPGIVALYEALKDLGHVEVVAPEHKQQR